MIWTSFTHFHDGHIITLVSVWSSMININFNILEVISRNFDTELLFYEHTFKSDLFFLIFLLCNKRKKMSNPHSLINFEKKRKNSLFCELLSATNVSFYIFLNDQKFLLRERQHSYIKMLFFLRNWLPHFHQQSVSF